jgi:hypothetical protein
MSAQASDDEAVLTLWSTWINRQWGDVIYLHEQREIVHETIDALNSKGENYVFANMLFQMYVRYQSLGVRRLIDRRNDTESLRRLMEEALSRRHLLSRARFVQAHVDAMPQALKADALANQHYDDLWGVGTVEPSKEQIEAEIKVLEKQTDAVRKFANKTQAHMADEKPDSLTLGELERAVDGLVKLFQRWAMTIVHTHRDERSIGAPDWREPFRSALFLPEQQVQPVPIPAPETRAGRTRRGWRAFSSLVERVRGGRRSR